MSTNVQSTKPVYHARVRRCPKFHKAAAFINIAKAVVKRLINLNLPNGRRWKAEDMVLVLAYSWIRGVSVDHSSNKLNKYGIALDPAAYPIYADGRRKRAAPHQTSVNDWLRQLTLKDAEKISQEVFRCAMRRFIRRRGRNLDVVLQFDLTYLGYWGKRRDNLIKGSKMVKGTRRIRHYHGALIHAAGISMFCALQHVAKHQSKIPFMVDTAKELINLGLNIKFCVVDREYYRYSVLAEFKKLGIDVITPAKEYDQLKEAKVAYLLNEKGRIQEYELSEGNKKGKNVKKIKVWLIILPRGKQHLNTIKNGYRKGNQSLFEAMDQMYGLITARAPQYSGSHFPYIIRKLYKMRWQIETAFRDNEVHKGIWRSNLDGTRFIGELGRYLLYNAWQEARAEDPRGERLTFQIYRDELVDEFTNQINL